MTAPVQRQYQTKLLVSRHLAACGKRWGSKNYHPGSEGLRGYESHQADFVILQSGNLEIYKTSSAGLPASDEFGA